MTSRLGLRRKTLLGIAEERGGRRGAGNAFANTGVAAIAAVLSALTYATGPALAAFVAALAAGGSDTAASEIGKAWGRRTYLVPTFRRVPPGTSGAVSLEGTAAGLIGAFALGGLGVAFGLIPSGALLAGRRRRDDRGLRRERAGRDARSAGRGQQRRPELSEHRHRGRRRQSCS